jgi:hypothetical protein
LSLLSFSQVDKNNDGVIDEADFTSITELVANEKQNQGKV